MDFWVSEGSKVNAFEIKSSGTGKHESIKEFCRKFSQNINKAYLISQKDVGQDEKLLLRLFYLIPFLIIVFHDSSVTFREAYSLFLTQDNNLYWNHLVKYFVRLLSGRTLFFQ